MCHRGAGVLGPWYRAWMNVHRGGARADPHRQRNAGERRGRVRQPLCHDASAILGLQCRGSSADGGELSVGERTRLSDLGLDVPCVFSVAGEAAVSGIVHKAIADATQLLQENFAYYINGDVYGAFNNLLTSSKTARLEVAPSAIHQQADCGDRGWFQWMSRTHKAVFH